MDIVILNETKKERASTELINNYVYIFNGVAKHERAKREVSILIHGKFHHKITDFDIINEKG